MSLVPFVMTVVVDSSVQGVPEVAATADWKGPMIEVTRGTVLGKTRLSPTHTASGPEAANTKAAIVKIVQITRDVELKYIEGNLSLVILHHLSGNSP